MKTNWSEVFERYKQLDTRSKALIKRAKSLDEIRLSTVLFQLGLSLTNQNSRVAFCLPFFNSIKNGNTLGQAIAALDDGDIGSNKEKYSTIGKRLMRVVRLDLLEDLYEFRRLLNFVAGKSLNKAINVEMNSACNTLYYWGEKSKKEMFENYLIKKYESKEETTNEQ